MGAKIWAFGFLEKAGVGEESLGADEKKTKDEESDQSEERSQKKLGLASSKKEGEKGKGVKVGF